jgi:hypothetical protein
MNASISTSHFRSFISSYQKKEIYQKIEQQSLNKTYQITKKDEIRKSEFILYITKDILNFAQSIFCRSSFCQFENKKCIFEIRGLMQVVELFAMNLLTHFTFVIERSK